VLVLVGEDQLVDESVAEDRIGVIGGQVDALQYVERALSDLLHIGAALVAAENRELVTGRPRILDRVVEAPEAAIERLALADRLDQPELLEVRDVPEVPGERAQDRRVLPVELFLGERGDQLEGAGARLGEPIRDLLPELLWCDGRRLGRRYRLEGSLDGGTLTTLARRVRKGLVN
jgi:hypothetical protein